MALLWLVASSTIRQNHYTLSFSGDAFVCRDGSNSEEIPLTQKPVEPKKLIAYRKEESYAVWDERGLTLRKGAKVKSYRLEDIPTSPKIFEPEEIEATEHEVSQGNRKLNAAGLSGSLQLGQRVYFLVRWNDNSNKPLFEALIQVDLDAADLTPFLVAKFDGVTGASDPVGDRLFQFNGGIGAITRRADDWGISTYSFATKGIDFITMGRRLDAWYPSGLYVETTAYDTKFGGQLNRDTMQSRTLFEDRGNEDYIDGDLPPVAIIHKSDALVLRDLSTGLEQSLSAQAQVRRTKAGILAWSPAKDPKHAVLLSYRTWTRLAVWNETAMRPRAERLAEHN